jgi:mono/diheme cytochrome c family protein
MRFRFHMARGIVLGLVLLTLTGCGEMYHQPAVQPLGAPLQVPPTAAVPITGVGPNYSGVEGKNLKNPTPTDQASVNRGGAYFATNCVMCHGLQGIGNGTVGAVFVPKPADLTSAPIQGLTDGDVFLVITNGFSTMPEYGSQLTPNQRWDVVNYVRTLGQR